jgi:hypothetical protein
MPLLNEMAWHRDDADPHDMVLTIVEPQREELLLRDLWPPYPASDRKLKMFALAVVRREAHYFDGLYSFEGHLCRRVLNHVEKYADDGLLQNKGGHLTRLQNEVDKLPTLQLTDYASNSRYNCISLLTSAGFAAREVSWGTYRLDPELQRELLRCVFGNPWADKPFWRHDRVNWQAGSKEPFRCGLGPVKEWWQNWCTPEVVGQAEYLYSLKDWASHECWALADALEESGCNHEGMLEHLRDSAGGGTRVHCRGCWVLDLILGYS